MLNPLKLQSPQSGRAVIDIAATVQKLKDVISELLPAHALSGCDVLWNRKGPNAKSGSE